MYKSLYLSPIVPSYNIPGSAKFFTDVLGFKVGRNDAHYVILYKDNLSIHIQQAGDVGEMAFYLEVDNIDAVWDLMKDNVKGIQHKAPFNQTYGMREIHVIVPHTKTLMFIGQHVGTSSDL